MTTTGKLSTGKQATAVCTPRELNYSETFLRDHLQRLPGPIIEISGTGAFRSHGASRIFPLPLRLAMHARHKLPERIRALADSLGQRRLAHVLRSHGVRVVLAEYGFTGVSMLPACVLAGIPLVVHFHGADAYDREFLNEYQAGYRALFGQAAGIVVVSREMERQLLRLGAPPERLFYNPCGVDLSLFVKTSPEASPVHFVAVGRFVEKKAPHLTLLAFNEVIRTVPNARLTMVGEGQLLGACRQLAIALRITSRVDFLGQRGQHEVARVMSTARAFVQHSVVAPSGDSEGMPVAVLEAGASGIPVVATRHAGIQEAVVHGETGLLVEEFDVSGMAERMIELAKDPELAGRLGTNAREHISRHFSVEARIASLAAILDAATIGCSRNR